jgi:hypothetical protein
VARSRTISGIELRSRIDRLRVTYTAAAPLFGLTPDGLHKQMTGRRPVSRQTEIIIDLIEENGRLRRQAKPAVRR